jgi:hypothetical protein
MTKLRIFLVLFAWGSAAFAQAYHPADAYRYVSSRGSDSNDGLSPGTAFATPQHCNAVVVALGGGTCDARTLYYFTTGTEIDVGQHSPAVAVTLLVPPHGLWNGSVSGGSSNVLKVFSLGSVIGTSAGQGNPFVIEASSGASVIDVCGTEPSPTSGSSYIHMEGFGCQSQGGATVSGAVIHIQSLFDVSRISDLSASASSANTKALWIHGVCCGTMVERVKGHGSAISGNVPCTIGSGSDSNQGGDIGPISCTGAGSGQNDLVIIQSSVGNAPGHYHDVYTEMYLTADTSTAVVAVTGSSGLSDFLDRLTLGADHLGSTRYMIEIANGTSLIARNIQLGGYSGNGINDHNPGHGSVSPGASAVITDYSTQNVCCALASYFTSLDASGIKNDKGLQLFDATATCTTAASVGATCTTASIPLPVAEPDTNYRVVCTGKGGGSGVAVIQSIINSSATQFTITIAALTAAAATFPSYDCMVGHN